MAIQIELYKTFSSKGHEFLMMSMSKLIIQNNKKHCAQRTKVDLAIINLIVLLELRKNRLRNARLKDA